VQVHHDEGVANHIDPEPCIVVRENGGEASAGERIGQPLSLENYITRDADALPIVEGNTDRRVIARPGRPGVVIDTGMCGSSLRGNREVSRVTGLRQRTGPHREGEEP
jgi:hypothetical protein